MSTPHLWHGRSEQETLKQLSRHAQIILALAKLLFQADKALYVAKNNGRNQVVIYDHNLQAISAAQDAIS